MLEENSLFGHVDKVELALERIKQFSSNANQFSPRGYHVLISGGKDSTVIMHLAIMSGVNCHFVHNITTLDSSITLRHLVAERKFLQSIGRDLVFEKRKPEEGKHLSFFDLVERKGLPTRWVRWCCQEFKEHGGAGEFCISGIRAAESANRAKRSVYGKQPRNI